jgi:WD40 repeat protein
MNRLILIIAALAGCGQPTSTLNDIYTADSQGNVYFYRGGQEKVSVRKCPAYAPLKAASNQEEIEAMVAKYCPATEANEKNFKAEGVRRKLKELYAQSYIAENKPTDPELSDRLAQLEKEQSKTREEAAQRKTVILKKMEKINQELERLETYFGIHPDLLDQNAKNQIAGLKTQIEKHSQELIPLDPQVVISETEQKKAEQFGKAFANFMDRYLFDDLFNPAKLVRLGDQDPRSERLKTVLSKMWNQDFAMKTIGNGESIIEGAFSPNGQRIVTGSDDETAKIWDGATGNQLVTLTGHSRSFNAFAFSPDGQRIVTGSLDKTAKIWDSATGKELLTLTGHSNWVESVAFSPDGRRIVTGSDDYTAKIWDSATGKELVTLNGHSRSVGPVTFSPDGQRIVTGSEDYTAKIWDSATGKELMTLPGHSGPVYSVALSPDGQRIVTGSLDKTAKIWDSTTGKELLTLTGHSNWVESVAFSPDGQRIVTGSHDRTAKIWDSATGKELVTLSGHSSWVESVAFSLDGQRLSIVTGRGVHIYDLDLLFY